MKNFLFIIALLFGSICTATAQTTGTKTKAALKTGTFEVNGNCGMCRNTIQKAAKKAGAETAEWNMETHILKVKYNPKKTDIPTIQKAVAASGYDNVGATASDESYEKLHSCCKYERKPMGTEKQ